MLNLWSHWRPVSRNLEPCCLFLQAAVKALETAKDLGHKALEIKTDSKYTINGKD